MSVSRKGKIIALANSRSALLIGAESGERAANNLERIRSICSALVMRAVPLRPTAALVAEEGRNTMPAFPSCRTIFNTYSKMLKIWRSAFEDVINIDAPDPVPLDELENIDVEQFDLGKRALVQDLIASIRELTRRNNSLKQLIAESVPTPADDLPPSADKVIHSLSTWLVKKGDGTFDIDDVGVRVSRKTPVRTVVMEIALFDELRTLADDYRNAANARAASRG